MSKITKPLYEIGTILVVTTFDGKNHTNYFFRIIKRRPNGNYIGTEFHPTQFILHEYTTCEGYKYELNLPDKAEGNNLNLKWLRKFECFSHESSVGFMLISNEIYDPKKHYYNEG